MPSLGVRSPWFVPIIMICEMKWISSGKQMQCNFRKLVYFGLKNGTKVVWKIGQLHIISYSYNNVKKNACKISNCDTKSCKIRTMKLYDIQCTIQYVCK